MSRPVLPAALAIMVVLALTPVSAADFGTYRTFTLGSSTDDVMARSGAARRDLKTLHERPSLLEELSWRSPFRTLASDPDPVAAIVFGFIDHQLFRMSIDYDRSRTQGLTKADILSSLSAVYGTRSARTAVVPKPAFDSLDVPTAVASWRQDDTLVVLTESAYSGSFGLVISSIRLEALARKARTSAVTMDTREAPARAAAQAKADADAERAAAEKIRSANKAGFTP